MKLTDVELPRAHEVLGYGNVTLRIIAQELGSGTSRRDGHWNHPPNQPAGKGVRCSACRWKEVRIYVVHEVLEPQDMAQHYEEPIYLLAQVGRSEVPGEHNRYSTIWAQDAVAVLDGLLLPPKKHFDNDGEMELPQPSADAMAEAAEHDTDLDEVLERWEAGEVVG